MSATVLGDVVRTREGGLTTLELRRADRLNTIDWETIEALEGHLDALEEDEGCVAVLLTTEGERAFVAGGDLRAFRDLTDEADIRQMSLRMGGVLRRLELLPSFVMAAVEGFAFGGGCEILVACDYVAVHPASTLAFSQVRFAVTPGWGGGARLVRRVGRARALELMLSGRRVDAREAVSIGLADAVHDTPRTHLREMAAGLPSKRSMVAALKAVASPAPDASWEAVLDRERDVFVESWLSPEHRTAVETFFRKN